MTANLADKKILLVDDDPDIVTSITAALSDSGATIHTCRDGSQAVEEFAKFVAQGRVHTEYVTVESEHSAMSAAVGASAAGARVMTATSSQGTPL